MMTKEEITEFRVAIIRKGITMKKFCDDRKMDRIIFSQELNGHARLKEETEQKMREFMKEYEKEAGNG